MFGKEVQTTSTVNDTVVHQISEMSSQVVVECSFTNFDRKKRKDKLRKSRKKADNAKQINEIGYNDKELAVLITNQNLNKSDNEIHKASPANDCEYELKMIYNKGSNNDQCERFVETVESISHE